MAEEKESFVFYKSFYEALQDLKDKDRLKVYDAICEMALNNTETQLTGIAKTVFTLIKPQVLANNRRYENGKKGGRPNKKTIGYEKEKTIGFENTETKTKPNVNVNDNVNENVNVNVNDNALGSADAEKIHTVFIETIGSTNMNNIKECMDYLDKLPFEVIEYVLKKTARAGAKWNYAVSILDDYVEKQIDSLKKVQANEIQFKNNNKTKEESQEEEMARKLKQLQGGLYD